MATATPAAVADTVVMLSMVAAVLQFVQLAGLTGTTATSSLREDSSGADASLPGPCPRPAGPVLLLGPRQGNLWLVNCLGQPQMVPLDHPGARDRTCCWRACYGIQQLLGHVC